MNKEVQKEKNKNDKKPFWRKWWVWLITAFVLLIVIGSGGSENQETKTAQLLEKSEEIVEIDTDQPIIQLDNQEQVEIGQEETPNITYTPPAISEKPAPAPAPQPEKIISCESWQVDINQASKEDLIKIKHIDMVRAEELIRLRPFKSIDGLTRIDGIASSRLNDIKAEGIACVQ
jgi:DNA uptake protein ComE-like DNA-binding protein